MTAQGPREPVRWLILTAGMGSGHDRAAGYYADRLGTRDEVLVVDVLDVLPAGTGAALRAGYAGALHHAPWLYEAVFRAFFTEHRTRPSVSPLVLLAAHRLGPVLRRFRPTVMLSTFHLTAQVAGHLRETGWCDIRSVVAITEPAAHSLWLHPSTDLFVCPYPWVAQMARDRTGCPAVAPGPIVDARFRRPGDGDAARRAMGLAPGEDAVVLSTGSWGVGRDVVATATLLAARRGVRPVVLCGTNERLRRRVAAVAGCVALGWRDDLPDLFAAATVLVDNAGGGTCAEAFAAGLPVVVWQPLPGHGRLGVRALVDADLVTAPTDPAALVATVEAARSARGRTEQCARARAMFVAEPAGVVADWAAQTGAGQLGRRGP